MGGMGRFASFLLFVLVLACDGEQQVPCLLQPGARIAALTVGQLKPVCLRMRGGLEPEGGKVRCDPPYNPGCPFRDTAHGGRLSPRMFLRTQCAPS